MMISKDSIELFFTRNSIKLVEDRDISSEEILKLYEDAKEFGYQFIQFVHYAVLNPEINKVSCNFNSFDEVYEFYLSFLIGFSGTKNN